MKGWNLTLDLHAPSPTPLFVRIARALEEDIRRGRLPPGAALPGSRTLAESLGVHRNTVLAAYRELETQGWISTSAARATYVSPTLPDVPARSTAGASRTAMPTQVGFSLPSTPLSREQPDPPRGTLVLAGGAPDIRLLPASLLARAYRRALKLHGKHLLHYGDARGLQRLRAALAGMLSSLRGLAVRADDLIVTRGSQGAVDLVARTLVTPGDTVAVEAIGYRPAWHAFQLAGARLAPIPLDGEGLRVEALEALAQRTPVRAVYLTPHHQYPTTVTLSPARRLALLAWARTHRVALIEDDYDHEFHFEGRPVLPLASADVHGSVVYVGSLSKMLAPGLRLGFVVPPRDLLEDLVRVRFASDRQGDHAKEAAVASLIDDGELARHVRRVRRVYLARRDVLRAELRRAFGERIHIEERSGGLALWAKLDADVERIRDRALERGVMFFVARDFTFDRRSLPFARFGFGSLDERELTRAVGVVARAARTRA